MSRLRLPLLAGLLLSALALAVPAPGTTAATSVGGCRIFPANNWWNRDISTLPVDRRSTTWLSHMSTGRNLHPDFGPSYGDGPNYGIPVTQVTGRHPRVPVGFTSA